jgi:hypothetical protein
MLSRSTSCLGILIVFSALLAYAQTTPILQNVASLPIGFEQNVGQVDTKVRFISHGLGYSVYLSRGELLVVFNHTSQHKGEVVRISITGVAKDVEPAGIDLLPGQTHYYIGNDPARWKTNVRQFRQVRYRNIYPGIDLVFYGNQRQLEFDFDVAPGADVSAIGLKLDGASMQYHAGNLELVTPSGNVAVLKKPEIYQGQGAARRSISGSYRLRKNNEIAFKVSKYDKRQALVIDPALIYSTFADIQTGGTLFGTPFAIAVDSTGATYITGLTIGGAGTSTLGPFSAFVLKLDPTGSTQEYLTLLGGTVLLPGTSTSTLITITTGTGIAVDAANNAYIVGMTEELDFPTTAGTYSRTSFCGNGGQALGCLEPFAARLDANGNLVYSTYLVQASALANAGPVPSSIAVDSTGALYVTGVTVEQQSGSFGVMPVAGLTTSTGAFQTARKNNSSGFVLKLHPDGSALDYSTYLGGSTGETPGGIAVDSTGVAYLDGGTSSADFPTTAGAFQTTNSGTNTFFTKLQADGSGLLYSTFLAGPGGQSVGTSLAIDSSNSAYLAGMTAATIPPPPFGRSGLPMFAAKFDASGNLVYSNAIGQQMTNTRDFYLGAPPASSITVDNTGAAYVASLTQSFDSSIAVSKLNADGTIAYSITSGSPVQNNFRLGGMAMDANKNFYIAGAADDYVDPASKSDLIPSLGTTIGAFQLLPANSNTTSHMFVQKWAQSLGTAVAVPSPRQVLFSPILQKGVTSLPRTVSLYNFGDADLSLSSIAITGVSASDFAISTSNNTCGAIISAGTGCSFVITFTPTVNSGIRNANATFTFGGGVSSQSVNLVGQAGVPAFLGTPNPLDFGTVTVGTSQQCFPENCSRTGVVLTNTGTAPLNFLAAPALLGTNSSDFAGAGNAGGKAVIPTPPPLPPGGSFIVGLEFLPTTAGTRTAQLVFVTDAPGSPQTVQLTGIALMPGNGNFAVAAANGSSTSTTVTAGQTATYNMIAAAGLNFTGGVITVNCIGAPAAAACGANPTSFSFNPLLPQQNFAVTVTTTAPTTASLERKHPGVWWSLAGIGAIILIYPRQRRMRGIFVMLASLALIAITISCGGGGGATPTPPKTIPGTPSGTFTLVVTATANGASNSMNLTLNVK